MAIRVGTVVTRQYQQSYAKGENPCIEHVPYNEDRDPILDVCVGMVIDGIPGESEVIVNWLQLCPYGVKTGQISQEGVNRDRLVEVGQLIPE